MPINFLMQHLKQIIRKEGRKTPSVDPPVKFQKIPLLLCLGTVTQCVEDLNNNSKQFQAHFIIQSKEKWKENERNGKTSIYEQMQQVTPPNLFDIIGERIEYLLNLLWMEQMKNNYNGVLEKH